MYVTDLEGNYDTRNMHRGFWIGPMIAEASPCFGSLAGPDGRNSSYFGSLTLIFDSSAYPSAFTAILEPCFGEWDQLQTLRAEPR